MRFYLLLICCLLLAVQSCTTYDLDPFDPRLPQYSNRGADVAGAYFNGGIWTQFCTLSPWNDDCNAIYVFYDSIQNASLITIPGKLTYDVSGNNVNTNIDIGFVFPDRNIDGMESLDELPEQVTLNGEIAYPTLIYSFNDGPVQCQNGFVSEGNLHIHRLYGIPADQPRGPKEIMAGTFGFRLESECWSFLVEQGRYDFDDILFINDPW
jgi:hypothetical protein